MSSSLNGSAEASTSNSNSNSNSTSTSATPSPSTAHEVGWLFVPQYYTFMNQNPGRLHCFYTKRSTLSHGEESVQEVTPCFGQQEIHDRITSFGYQDAKVWVSTIDSQASANGGIVIQVIGELSNNNGPWRRFCQTFFLAEQPKGYFVLNDIFRYLKDDNEVDGIAEALDENAEAEAVAEQQDALNAPGVSVVSSSTEEKPEEVTLDNVKQPGATPHVEPQASKEKESLQSIADSVTDNSVAPVPESTEAPAAKEGASTVEPAKEAESVPTPAAAAPESVAKSPAPAAAETTSTPAAAPAPAPTPAAPAAPKTWANLAASGASKWGANVSAETRATSARPAATSASPASRPAVSTGPKPSGNGQASSNPSVFIKSVNLDMMTEEELKTGLESQYGKLRECSVIPSKGCAFAEFLNQDHAKQAVKDSLPVSQGGKGGIAIGKRNWVITIEEKRGAGQKPAGGTRGGRGGGNQGAPRTGGARTNAPRGRNQAA